MPDDSKTYILVDEWTNKDALEFSPHKVGVAPEGLSG
jgi:hypothetical protein